eukprot:CAMPEP_0169115096 /NCGR_PEP_ID=MMETSP1015-20121227/29154_1 /TAXON_ID=342587 /ORGANISM="Karlodinium micrum, Strain CCMP2283" /LENGTH=211 /DNA_ID=CAMNT_0009177513 /DNA_START=49 /DNA_END=684 /DNA_ORIENTATION=-
MEGSPLQLRRLHSLMWSALLWSVAYAGPLRLKRAKADAGSVIAGSTLKYTSSHNVANASVATTAKLRYVLMQYSNQYCGFQPGACQELFADGLCHLTGPVGSSDLYVKMQLLDEGKKAKVLPGTDSTCSCHNQDALSETYTIDTVDIYGKWVVPENQGCLTSHGNGYRLAKGYDDNEQFNKQVIKACTDGKPFGSVMKANISGSGSCNYPR